MVSRTPLGLGQHIHHPVIPTPRHPSEGWDPPFFFRNGENEKETGPHETARSCYAIDGTARTRPHWHQKATVIDAAMVVPIL